MATPQRCQPAPHAGTPHAATRQRPVVIIASRPLAEAPSAEAPRSHQIARNPVLPSRREQLRLALACRVRLGDEERLGVAGHLGVDSDAPGATGALGADFAHAVDRSRERITFHDRVGVRPVFDAVLGAGQRAGAALGVEDDVAAGLGIDADLPRASGAVAGRLRERGGDLGGCELGRWPVLRGRDRELEGAGGCAKSATWRARARATRAASTSARARAGCGARRRTGAHRPEAAA